MKNTKNKVHTMLIDFVVSLIGCFIFSYAYYGFLMPNEIATGGVGGISSALTSSFGFKMGLLLFCINTPLLILAFIFLGKKFTFNTTLVIVETSFMLDYVSPLLPRYTGQQLLGTIFGSFLLGLGIAIIFTRGFTTGGTDIIGRLLQLKFPSMSIGKLMMLTDFFIICLSSYIYTFGEGPNNAVESAMYGLICTFIYTKTIDTLLAGTDQKKVIYIMSDKKQQIIENLMESLHRGLTSFHVTKVYSQKESEMIMCIIKSNEITKVKSIIKKCDSSAFLMILNAEDVIGGQFQITDSIK